MTVDGPSGWAGRERMLALSMVLVLTLIAVGIAVHVENRRAHDRLRGRAAIAAQATRAAVDGIVASLAGAPGVVGTDGRADRAAFDRFGDGLLTDPTIRGISLLERVSDAERPAFERQARVHIRDPAPEGGYRIALRRNQYMPTVDIRPPTLGSVLGFDPLGDPQRGTAIRAARDRGTVALSRPVTLVSARTTGLVAYVPLYRGGRVPTTLAARRRAFTGSISASFEAPTIRRRVLAQLRGEHDLRILDRDTLVTGPDRPLADGAAVTVPIAGRRWTVALSDGEGASALPAVVAAIAGLLLALLVDSRTRRLVLLRAAAERQERLAAEREVALTQQQFLAESGTVLDSSLDVGQTLQALADLLVPDLAGWCAVSLVEGPAWRTVAVAHTDPVKRRLAADLDERWPADRDDHSTGVGKVLATGEPELFPEVPHAVLAELAQDEEHLAALSALGMTSVMVLPLRARGRVLGALTLISDDPARLYDEDDVAYAEQLARRAALAVDNAQLHERTVRTAQTLQAGLLPTALPAIPDVALAARYHPVGEDTEVGGDFYDVHVLETGGWAVTVGDVCGKGAEAAALTALIRYTLRAVADDGPSEAMRRLNEAVLHQRPDGTFATLVHVHALPDGDDLRLLVACAGHPQPVVRRADGSFELLAGRGPLVGAFGGLRWTAEETVLRPGDAVALYTDGVTEAHDRALSPDDVLARLTGVGPGAEQLADALERLAIDAPRAGRDDVAVLVVERLAPSQPTLHELPADAQAPGLARGLIEPHLARLAVERREAARLLVTETVTNAVRHGTPPHAPIVLLIEDLPAGVRFEVRDRGAGLARVPDPPPPGSAGGYGLQLVQELSDRWGWRGDAGTVIWFELDATTVAAEPS